MASFLDYIKGMIKIMPRDNIVESAVLAQSEINDKIVPTLRVAADLFAGQKMSSKVAQAYIDEIRKIAPGKNTLTELKGIFENAGALLGYIEEHSDKIFSKTETADGLTYPKVTALRVVQAITFANKYVLKMLIHIYQEEAESQSKEPVGKLTPNELKWIKDNSVDFFIALKVLKTPAKEFGDFVKTIPDAVITEMTEATFSQTVGLNKLDPMGMRNISVKWNPFYLIGMAVASYQEQKFKATEEELQLIQLRVMQLQKLKEKINDPGLEKEIIYRQEQVTELTRKLEKMEKEYDL